ncbi:MAG: heparan-alpha-glucosaminide N-acetyltransferase domain-containing protein [Bdellovibrionota bacterium]
MEKRVQSIDAFRALAIVKMLLCHFVLYLAANREPNSWIVVALCGHYGSFGAQFFTFTVGLSFYFSDKKHWADGRAHGFSHHLRRAFWIFVIGIVFASMAWSFDGALDWDILTLIAFSIFVLALARRLPSSAIFLLLLLVVVAAPFLRQYADFYSYWRNESFEYAARWDGVHDLIGFFVTGFFPIFPWLSFPLAGYLVARCLFSSEEKGRKWSRVLLFVGLALLVVGPILEDLGNP